MAEPNVTKCGMKCTQTGGRGINFV